MTAGDALVWLDLLIHHVPVEVLCKQWGLSLACIYGWQQAFLGRVPDACGYSFETSPKPPASSDSTGHEPSKSVFNPSLAPLGLHLSTPSLSTS